MWQFLGGGLAVPRAAFASRPGHAGMLQARPGEGQRRTNKVKQRGREGVGGIAAPSRVRYASIAFYSLL